MARRNRKDNTSDPVISEDKSFRRTLLNINNWIIFFISFYTS